MVWCEQRQLIFIHIPKTGGTSVEAKLRLLKRANGYGIFNKRARQHFFWKDYLQLLGDEKYNMWNKFSICRNPYDKLISEYFWCPVAGHRKNQTLDEFIDYCKEVVEADNYDETIYHDHFIPQHKFIFDNNNNLQINKLFRFEDYDELEKYLLKEHNINNKKKINVGKHKKEVILNEFQKKKIYEIYKKDFELLNYSCL